jgi:hypothetical protein
VLGPALALPDTFRFSGGSPPEQVPFALVSVLRAGPFGPIGPALRGRGHATEVRPPRPQGVCSQANWPALDKLRRSCPTRSRTMTCGARWISVNDAVMARE